MTASTRRLAPVPPLLLLTALCVAAVNRPVPFTYTPRLRGRPHSTCYDEAVASAAEMLRLPSCPTTAVSLCRRAVVDCAIVCEEGRRAAEDEQGGLRGGALRRCEWRYTKRGIYRWHVPEMALQGGGQTRGRGPRRRRPQSG